MISLFNYIGKKNYNFEELLAYLGVETYVEPFSGSYQVGLNSISDKNKNIDFVVNDIDKSIYLIWKEAKRNLFELIDEYFKVCKLFAEIHELDEILHNIAMAEDDKRIAACNMFLCNSIMFNGGTRYDIDNVRITNTYSDPTWVRSMLGKLCRLSIYNLDYREIIDKYDAEGTFLFLDPPYYLTKTNIYYGANCSYFYHKEFAERVKKARSKWLMTYNVNDYISWLYKDFRQFTYKESNYRNTLYIWNFDVSEETIKRVLGVSAC